MEVSLWMRIPFINLFRVNLTHPDNFIKFHVLLNKLNMFEVNTNFEKKYVFSVLMPLGVYFFEFVLAYDQCLLSTLLIDTFIDFI